MKMFVVESWHHQLVRLSNQSDSSAHRCVTPIPSFRKNGYGSFITFKYSLTENRDLIRFYCVHFFHMQTFPLDPILKLLCHLSFSCHAEEAALDRSLNSTPVNCSFASLAELQFSTGPPQFRWKPDSVSNSETQKQQWKSFALSDNSCVFEQKHLLTGLTGKLKRPFPDHSQ